MDLKEAYKYMKEVNNRMPLIIWDESKEPAADYLKRPEAAGALMLAALEDYIEAKDIESKQAAAWVFVLTADSEKWITENPLTLEEIRGIREDFLENIIPDIDLVSKTVGLNSLAAGCPDPGL